MPPEPGLAAEPGAEISLDFPGGWADRLRRRMTDRPRTHADDAFAAETSRVMARRAPLGLGFLLGLAAVAGLLEVAYYPDRVGRLAAAFAAEVILGVAALLAIRGARLRRFVIPITGAAAFG